MVREVDRVDGDCSSLVPREGRDCERRQRCRAVVTGPVRMVLECRV